MRRQLTARRSRAGLVAVALIAAAAIPLGLTSADAAPTAKPAQAKSSLYIVQTAGSPVATYRGSVDGYAKTRPAPGKLVNADTENALAYRSYLADRHAVTLSRAGISTSAKKVDYSVAFNGFAASLTSAQAAALSHQRGVLHVWKSETRTADTTTTPTFLGLTGRTGVWQRQFGGPTKAGKGIIVGVIDSGIWPEDSSFDALPRFRPDAADIAAQWHGTCDVGIEEPIACNNKLIGARYYNAGGLAQDYEFLSPRDYNGHGSHTAGTAVGDYNKPVSINGLPLGSASGMAPVARLAVYKALWHNDVTGSASGTTADLVAAIDDAVADGVDVINYSVSGSTQFVVDPVELAFLNAAAAGVFVSTSAGNSGPGASTVAHNSPWLMTVAASTHDRGATKTVTLGNGATYDGVGVGPAVASAPLIDSATAGSPGAPVTDATLCFSGGALDPAKVAGKIVLCQRGTNDRVDKSLAVQEAGGVGMILFNPTPNSLNADFHYVPSIHVDEVSGAAIKAYAATAGATAAISASVATVVEAPVMAGFSSAGPALAGGGDLLKPDITAPGVDVIAAVAPPGNDGQNWGLYSGTSMAAPHIAGIAALIKSKHPDWSPMWIKSAMMTNATTLDNAGNPIADSTGADGTPLQFGSGHVRPAQAFNPGLVYDSSVTEWLEYGCSIDQVQLVSDPSLCASLPETDPSDLNYPSISIGDIAGSQAVTRTLTNITGGAASRYRAVVDAPDGFKVKLSAWKLFIRPHTSASYTATITRTTAPLDEWAFGSITWIDRKGHAVRSPIAVRPVALAAAPEVAGTGTSGSATLSLKAGYTGTLQASAAGLVAADVTPLNLDVTGPAFDPAAPAVSPSTGKVTVTVPAASTLARFATFDADYPAGTDADLFVYQAGTSTLVGQSAGGTAEESVTLTAAGTYDLYVNLFAMTGGTTLTLEPNVWVLGSTAAGNFTVTPASQAVTTGGGATVTAAWTGLTAGVRYLGAVTYSDGTNTIGRTIISVG